MTCLAPDQIIRLECLKLALEEEYFVGRQVLDRANTFATFVRGSDHADRDTARPPAPSSGKAIHVSGGRA